jgi:hypothetical protein
MFVLLVTWFVVNQPPASYQTEFSFLPACEDARASLLADAERLRVEQTSREASEEMRPGVVRLTFGVAPRVSAVCVRRDR